MTPAATHPEGGAARIGASDRPHLPQRPEPAVRRGWIVDMIYRMRIYRTPPDGAAVFHEFFRTWLLPVQLRHGARLVGRWETEDDRVVAVWEYDDRAAYERIQAAVSRDPDSRRAQEHRKSLPVMFTDQEEIFMNSTL